MVQEGGGECGQCAGGTPFIWQQWSQEYLVQDISWVTTPFGGTLRASCQRLTLLPVPPHFCLLPTPPSLTPRRKISSPCLKQSNPLPPPPGPDGGRGSSPSRKHSSINEEGSQVNLEDKLSSLPDKSVKYLHITYKCWGVSGLNADNRIASNTLLL